MKFSSFNKQRLFSIDTSSFDYESLEELYKANPNKEYVVRGLYIGTKSEYNEESPILATDEFYVNLPQHQLSEVKEILASPQAIRGINNGEAGFKIETYYQARYKKNCYKVVWTDRDPSLDM